MGPTELLLIGVAVFLYFLPAFIAWGKEHHNAAAIFALNLILGWTLLGWVIALVWALTNQAPKRR